MKNTDRNNGMTFKDYFEFIYLNSFLDESDALELANYCWNRNIDKFSALELAKNN